MTRTHARTRSMSVGAALKTHDHDGNHDDDDSEDGKEEVGLEEWLPQAPFGTRRDDGPHVRPPDCSASIHHASKGKDASPGATLAGVAPKTPVLDLFIGRDGDGWRLYVAATSWKPEVLRRRIDEHGEIFPVGAPDLATLDRVMWNADAPFDRRPTTDGGVEILARGRSAKVLLLGWLAGIVGRQGP
jgi:hypothetical protein